MDRRIFTVERLLSDSSRWLVLLLLSLSSLIVAAQMTAQESSEPAYILFSADFSLIKKMNIDGSNVETLYNTGGFQIIGLDYHHRLNSVFFFSKSLFSFSFLFKLNLDTKEVERLHTSSSMPRGIAVDWINDKVYWTEETGKIMKFDIHASNVSEVATVTGEPLGIGIIPYRNNVLLYFIERNTNEDSETTTLVRLPLQGGTQTNLLKESMPCLHALTMDYKHVSVYWNAGCRKQIDVIKADGTGHRRIYDGNDLMVANSISEGIAYYDHVLYWTDTERVFTLNTISNGMEQIFESGAPNAIRIFHSSLQPSEDQLELYEMCNSVPCVNGQCISNTTLCACNSGWTGDACDQDINECQENNGGCQDICTNTVGSYQCSCNEGRILESNDKSCFDPRITTTSLPKPTSAPAESSPSPQTDSKDIHTDPIPDPTTQLSSKPTTDSADKPSTNPIPDLDDKSSTDPVPDPITSQLPVSTDANIPSTSTTAQELSTSPVTHHHLTTARGTTVMSSTTNSHSAGSLPTEEQPIKTTDHSNEKDSASDIKPTKEPDLAIPKHLPTDGIKAKAPTESSPNLLIIILTLVITAVVLAAIICFVLVYCKHSKNRRGSYDVQRRNKTSDAESATSSARSSFRAVSEYHYSSNLESGFLNQVLPGSTSSMSEQSTTSTVPREESLRLSLPSESESAASSPTNESSTDSESQPLRHGCSRTN